jgi:alpha-amylase/alpha-mannosidase (GH57 family)
MSPIAGFHLHLYQPPREDPWLGRVTNEWSAWPYRDWNERITDECYRALVAVAVATDNEGDVELVEPLPLSAFDIAPTLHRWLARESPDVDQAVRFEAGGAPDGASSVAMAAPLVHAILPLASATDKERLVAWGLADYVRRFGELPLGMWLPETAVDLATLEVLAGRGVRYTILMPSQAARVREPGGEWRTVDGDSLDTSRAYLVRLGGDRTIKVVFGHRDLSQRVAFGDLLGDGVRLADEMADALGDDDGVVLLVADGETYGHHHRFGDVGLAWALRRLREHYGVETALGPWLAGHEPTHEVELAPVSAWSCAHGVERWRADCGCVTGGRPGWRQTWRKPLRESLDWLRDELGRAADERLAQLVDSPDATVLAYGVALAGASSPEAFVAVHASRGLSHEETTTVLELCEIHRHLLYSFTSCAWFFADPGDLETAIVLRHAAAALEIARDTLGLDLEPTFLERLALVHSNRPGLDGRALWRRANEPYRMDGPQIAAGFAAERAACGDEARSSRGNWRAEFEVRDEGAISVVNVLTGRRRSYTTRAVRVGALGVRVIVNDGVSTREFDLVDLGLDVVARMGTAWLVGPGSTDYERALHLLTAALLTRSASRDDVETLLALASAARCATPASEASIRRAVLAVAGGSPSRAHFDLLAPLARAVGLDRSLARS